MTVSLEVDCAGCGSALVSDDGYGQIGGLYGCLCPACFDLATKRRGRMCNTCINRAYARWGAKTVGVLNNHRQRHSKVVDDCVDAGIRPFIDEFNLNVTRTWVSCEGQPRPASWRPGPAWIDVPYVGVSERLGGDTQAVLDWAAANHDRYKIRDVTQRWDIGHDVCVTFRELPGVSGSTSDGL